MKLTEIIMCFDRHNFYVFPRQELPVEGPSYEFLCQTTSIDFLARYQFDFNACIHEGSFILPFCICFWTLSYNCYYLL